MSQALNRYKADLRELHFVLFEQLGLGDVLGEAPFQEWGPDEVKMVLEETYRFATDVLGPLNGPGDAQGCRIEEGRLITPDGFREAWTKLYEAGWRSLAIPAEFGGQGAPTVLAAAVEEMLSGANTAFNMYPGLAQGAAEVVAHFGTDRQKALYAQRMFDGRWGGTMCLTEAQAGSDVGAATTSAKKLPDGTYAITGTKIFISGGDHDLAENIVHLVLARVQGAAVGTKGLSLFIVPRVRVSDDGALQRENDVALGSIEHKMGINASSTCVLNFGENGACVGELVGEVEHQGMRQMFKMMNYARIGVGIQGLGVASSAYLNAVSYAKERKQGAAVKDFKDPTAERVAIIEHPNVRHMLMEMKSKVEGIRMLVYKLAFHQDRSRALAGQDDDKAAYHQGQVDLLVPLVKAYGSDQAFRVCEVGIQVMGGAGYLRDWPLEQYARDSKIFSIYEGTNSIQAMDLVARKLGQEGGRNTQAFLADVGRFVAEHRGHPTLGPSMELLGRAQEAFAGTAMQLMVFFQSGEMERIPLVARAVLEMMSELSVGWLLLEAAVLAERASESKAAGHPDRAFYAGKVQSAVWFARHVLSGVPGQAETIASGDRSALDIPTAGFAGG